MAKAMRGFADFGALYPTSPPPARATSTPTAAEDAVLQASVALQRTRAAKPAEEDEDTDEYCEWQDALWRALEAHKEAVEELQARIEELQARVRELEDTSGVRIADLEQALMELLAMPACPGSYGARKAVGLMRLRAAALLNIERRSLSYDAEPGGANGGKL
jgi:flagellar motor protein MotB